MPEATASTPREHRRYHPHADPRLRICTECSAPDNPAIIPADTLTRHDLWHDLTPKDR